MADIIREALGEHHRDEARAFIQKICTTEANLRPDSEAGTLTVEIHSLATPKANRILKNSATKLTIRKLFIRALICDSSSIRYQFEKMRSQEL
jgi:hypothetical protein